MSRSPGSARARAYTTGGGWANVALAVLLVLAACGGATSLPPNAAPAAAPSGDSRPLASEPSSSVTAVPSATPATAEAAQSPAPIPPVTGGPAVVMKPPVPSAMVADLLALGLDAANLPPIEKLEPTALRRVMKLLARSLGARCGDCHAPQRGGDGSDFAAPTRRKKIAAKMWDELVVKLQMADGSALFCDSCHQGRIAQLDRADEKALRTWMGASFVGGLKRKDGMSHDCETCHVHMEMHLLTKWGGG